MAKNPAPSVDADPAEEGSNPQETSPVTPEEVTKSVSSSKVLPDAQAFGGPDMPAIQPHAVEAAREAQTPAEAPTPTADGAPRKGETDFKGRTFDPRLHEVHADGKPAINRDGFIKCFRGKPAGTVSDTPARPAQARSKVDPTGGKAAAPIPPPDQSAQIDTSATAFTGMFLTAATLVGGEEFAPESGEPEAIKSAFAQYFAAKGVVDVPPGVMLGGVMVMYIAKRWNAPKFVARRESWTEKGKRWLNDFRYRRQLAREKASELASK